MTHRHYHSKVSIIKSKRPITDEAVEEAVTESINLLGGMKNFVKPGDRVLVKPNFVKPDPPPTTTDPRVIRAVAKLVAEAGAKPVIGEGASSMTLFWREGVDSSYVMRWAGMQKIAEEFSGEVVPFDARGASDVQNVTIPGARIMREANIVRPALECDKIIPIACYED